MRLSRWFFPLVLCPLALGAAPVALAAESVLALVSPNGLVSSTGNLYWTSTTPDAIDLDVSTVWRASKGNTPGTESVLYREIGDDRSFGSIVWANPGAFFGYFVANYQTSSGLVSQIKRVPLSGGAAVVIATSPAPIGMRDLVTDGATLFWVDAGGIRSVPLGGGAVTTVYSSAFVTRLRVDSQFLYWGEQFLIFRKAKAGGTPGVVVSTNGWVTALHVDESIGWLFWGERGGAVVATPSAETQGIRVFFQDSSPSRDITSVGWDGSRALWTDCVQPYNINCAVRKRQGASNVIVSVNGVGVGRLQWDGGAMYWGDAGTLRKFVH